MGLKKQIIPVLVNTERNTELLKEVIHEEFLDLSVTWRFVQKTGEKYISAPLTVGIINAMGMSLEEITALAKENMNRIFIPELWWRDKGIQVISNKEGVYGAAGMLDKNVLKTAAANAGGDILLIPASIHEIFVLPEAGQNLPQLYRLLAELKYEMDEDVFLSDRIYKYEIMTGNISFADA